mgnify:CR=1 FL=1
MKHFRNATFGTHNESRLNCMKNIFTLITILCSISAIAQKDYQLHIDDQTLDIAADEEYTMKINGKSITVKLTANDTISFDSELYTFDHSKEYKVSQLKIDADIEQSMIMTAGGSGFLIQEYGSFNPSMLNDMMLSEVTKESLSYGYEMEKSKYTKTLVSGQEIEVTRAELTYKDSKSIYEVASIGSKDEGILILTMISDIELSEEDEKIIAQMRSSLVYKE